MIIGYFDETHCWLADAKQHPDLLDGTRHRKAVAMPDGGVNSDDRCGTAVRAKTVAAVTTNGRVQLVIWVVSSLACIRI
jgi:hypothetical protein